MRRPQGPSRKSQRMVTVTINGEVCTAWYQPCCGFDAFSPRRPNGSQGRNPIVRWWCPRCNVERPKGASAAGLPSLMEYNPSVSLSMWPHLDELLLDPNWADLTPKGRRCLMVFLDESFIRVLFKLDNDCLKTSAVGESWDAALTNLDALIRSGKLVWEQDTPRQARGKKK